MSARTALSVVIPTYNEIDRLGRTLEEIRAFLDVQVGDYEVLVVDDCSPDGTKRLVEETMKRFPQLRLLSQPARLGKGAAVRRGCLEAQGESILFMDADHATPIEEVAPMLHQLRTQEGGMVAGVRTYQEDESRWRRILGLCALLLSHLIVFRKAVIDSQCGFKLVSRDLVQRIFPYCRVNGGMFDIELISLLQAFGLRCYYHPVHWANKPGSRVNVIKCLFLDPFDLVKIRLRFACHLYRRPLEPGEQPWAKDHAAYGTLAISR